MRKFKDEFGVPLDKVHRSYLRKPFTVIIGVIAFFLVIPFAIIDGWVYWWNDFIKECWIGNKD